MTYCCGILVRDGLVMFADTRTNAGVDNISTFRKLHVLAQPGERIMAIATAGNLSISQSVVSMLREGWENPRHRRDRDADERPHHVPGGATRRSHHSPPARPRRQGAGSLGREDSTSRFCWADRSRASGRGCICCMPAGNFIECTQDTPYLQIGEHKYGKPVLDRAITYDIDLYDALKVGLVSVNSTMRSNLSVGLPLDILIARRDACDAELNFRIEPGEPYFHDLRERWSAALRAAHAGIPRPPYKNIR